VQLRRRSRYGRGKVGIYFLLCFHCSPFGKIRMERAAKSLALIARS
jgi:hypothetical protein